MAQAHGPEAREVTAVDDPRRELEQVANGGDGGAPVGAGAVGDERPVVEDVLGDQDTGPLLEEREMARRMTGGVEHVEDTVAEIDPVAVGDELGRGRRCDAVESRVTPFAGSKNMAASCPPAA